MMVYKISQFSCVNAWLMVRAMKTSALAAVLLALLAPTAFGCAPTSHPETVASFGVPMTARGLDAVVDQPGPVEVETVVGATWHVPLSGLLNLDHPKAKAAHLVDHEEPIHVAFHALRHPTYGTYLVDTGTEHALFDDPSHAAIQGIVASVMKTDEMKRVTDTRSWIEAHGGKVAGVFLTHLHLDHVSGLRDVPAGTTVFTGPGETRERNLQNFLVAPNIDRALDGKPALATWAFTRDPDGVFDGILDVLGDQSVFAIHVPGHTAGSTAYVARTPRGPVLLTGDACHTAWGWTHGVEPGTYSEDKPRSARSLEKLRAFALRHPAMDVRLGHQTLTPRSLTAAAR
jgi:N-acyl homoserine lactone hydrolase